MRIPVILDGYQVGWATPVEGTDGISIELFGAGEVHSDVKETIESIRNTAMEGLSIED